ncbi:MAG: CRTAC1 family protein [Planctomycetota bacterium]
MTKSPFLYSSAAIHLVVRRNSRALLAGVFLLGMWLSPVLQVHAQETEIRFEDVTEQANIDFIHRDGSSGKYYLVEAISGSLASFDYDRDGRVDLYFLNGAALKGTSYPQAPLNQLHRNIGNFQFENVAEFSGLDDDAFSLGVSIGDYDNDGFQDVYVTNMGPNVLFRNNGDGTFLHIEQKPLACGEKTGAGASMLDIDNDGNLDIYAASYMKFDYAIPASEFRGRLVYGGPLLYPKVQDDLLRNDGSGNFANISEAAGITMEKEWGMGTVCADFDGDGDTDIFVANDSTKNFLWINDGTGKFTETALFAGVAFDFQGDPQGSMGVDVADLNADGWLDLFQTAYTTQLATLYRNDEGFLFEDATRELGVGKGTFHPVNWGTGLGDFDNDGDKDVFISNGHIHDNMDDVNTAKYKCKNFIFENLAGKRFIDITDKAGNGTEPIESSRGSVQDDLDNDGKLDIVVVNSRLQSTVMRNASLNSNNWIKLELIGTKTNRSGIGSQVTVVSKQGSQLLEVQSGKGYQSHFGSILQFGIGSDTQVEAVEVRWLGGEKQVFENLKPNTCYILREGDQTPFSVK